MDVRKLPFVNNPTIEEMYETTKLSVLRMYISTKEIERDDSTSGEASCEETDHVSDDSGDEIPAIDRHVMTDVGSEVTVGTSQQVMTELSDLEAGHFAQQPFRPTAISPNHTISPNQPGHFAQLAWSFRPTSLVISPNQPGHFAQPAWSFRPTLIKYDASKGNVRELLTLQDTNRILRKLED
ncbi:hypothetical protein BSL78_21841 [Apostichopus japonicus]|uniref:Uncharacterized protein n=1 Tax=Stichopus japonicus TaxID=307972 RepID=A0A2G8JZX0_STIJA|nr:hypothetical protein BSL78_21841 [Apostichopus japonicus]